MWNPFPPKNYLKHDVFHSHFLYLGTQRFLYNITKLYPLFCEAYQVGVSDSRQILKKSKLFMQIIVWYNSFLYSNCGKEILDWNDCLGYNSTSWVPETILSFRVFFFHTNILISQKLTFHAFSTHHIDLCMTVKVLQRLQKHFDNTLIHLLHTITGSPIS
jgi:hypothetical protein